MYDILVYLLDQQYEDEIISSLQGRRYIFHHASSSDEVVEICKQDFIDLILVWPANSEVVADVLTVLNMKELGYIPVIPVVRKDEDLLPILQMPVADVVEIPLPKHEFFLIVEQTLRSLEGSTEGFNANQWQGNLEEFSLVDLIQMVEAGHKDAILTLSYKDHLGQVFFRQGKVIRATLRNLSTMQALQKMASLPRGSFQVNFTQVDITDDVEMKNQELLITLLEQIAEQEKYYQVIPDPQGELVVLNKPSDLAIHSLKAKILEFCSEGQTIYDILISLNEDNLEILKEVQELVQDGYLVRSQDYAVLSNKENDKKGLGKFFASLTDMFKKNKKEETELVSTELPESINEVVQPQITYQIPPVTVEEIQKIQNKLKDLGNANN